MLCLLAGARVDNHDLYFPQRQLSPDVSKLESLLDTDRQVVMELFFSLTELQRALPAYPIHDKWPEVFIFSLAYYIVH